MKHIDVDEQVYRVLQQRAAAWHTTVAGALARVAAAGEARPLRRPKPVAVHGIYSRTRVEARFEPDTYAVTIASGPLRHAAPDGAYHAVVSLLNPSGSPAGSGWDFWRLTDPLLRMLLDRDGGR